MSAAVDGRTRIKDATLRRLREKIEARPGLRYQSDDRNRDSRIRNVLVWRYRRDIVGSQIGAQLRRHLAREEEESLHGPQMVHRRVLGGK